VFGAAGRAVRVLLVVAGGVAFVPVTIVAAGTTGFGWWRGMPPGRLARGALWCVPMVAGWLAAVAAWGSPGGAGAWAAGTGAGAWWFRVVAAPYRAWAAMWRLGAHGDIAAAAVAIAAPALPLGILAGSWLWRRRIFRMETGSGGRSPATAARFDAGLWRRQVRAARAVSAAPGSLPLLARNGSVVTGAVIRSVRHDGGRAAAIPYDRLRSHQVVIGSTGTGKTTLLLRLWAGFMAGGMRRYAAGQAARPLLVVLDCKGGASSRKVADRARRVLRDAGAAATATWPDEASLNLWSLPPGQLVTTLLDLIEHGTGGAAYYTDVMETLVSLAVQAPGGPPTGSADFLRRLDAEWLTTAYEQEGDAEGVGIIRSGKKAVDDVALRFRALWRRLGSGLDGGGSFGDADAWYCVLEGTSAASVAEAQARALTDLLASFAMDGRREILLAVDEYSAVSRRLPIWRLQERARSLGVAIQVSAQSWEGLAGTEDERLRVAGTAEGGIWLLRTPRPEPVVALAGTRPAVSTSRHLTGPGSWERAGLSAAQPAPVVDGDLVRQLDVGQAAYVYRGGVTYLQVKRLIGRQAALAAGVPGVAEAAGTVAAATVAAGAVAVGSVGAGSGELPDVSEVLDEAFGRRDE
jgi:hypothetical protein